MALIDVKEYYLKMLSQYVEVKNDLTDFEQALKDGYITEDKLNAAKEDVERIKENLDRLSYIMFLFGLPRKKKNKVKYSENESNKLLLNYFNNMHATSKDVEAENIEVLAHLREELKNLRKE